MSKARGKALDMTAARFKVILNTASEAHLLKERLLEVFGEESWQKISQWLQDGKPKVQGKTRLFWFALGEFQPVLDSLNEQYPPINTT